jgi:hypothetical protein
MSTTIPAPAASLVSAAQAAGLTLTAAGPGTDFTGKPTTRITLALAGDPAKSQLLELSTAFDADDARFADGIAAYFADAALRLRNPQPDFHLSLHGLPLSFRSFAWPFHGSTSGADTFIVHGEVHLADGTDSPLHAKVSASLTQTFATVLAALEQPFAEGIVVNAVRKTLDQGQLELVKSGNRQPVPVTTRYYSMRQQVFVFNDTTEAQRRDYLAAKVFWLGHVLGGGAPVWIADQRDAQYLNTTVADLKASAAALVTNGLVLLEGQKDWASPTDTLRNQEEKYRAAAWEALEAIKPTFNAQMRSGNTNM